MFTKDANQEVDAFILIHWLLMSVCAGVLNTIAFIGLGTFATHVTGFATLFGIHVSGLQYSDALAALAVPLFFLVGATISGLCVEARVRQNKMPHYDYVMYFCSFLLIVACVFAGFRNSDVSQTYVHVRENFVLLSLICLASGLLNAALSYSSHSTVRITHLTGVTTDLGRGIAELISLRTFKTSEMRKELRLNLLRGLTIVSFMIGSLIGAILFRTIMFYALLVPAAYLAYAGEHGRRMKASFQLIDVAGGVEINET